MNIESSSKDNSHNISLKEAGEIRFGPCYYNLKINNLWLGERVFGNYFLWSDDSRFLAIQEWLTVDYAEGPLTALTLFDLMMKKECRVSRAEEGFIIPTAFEKDLLIYKKEYSGKGIVKEFEIDFRLLDNWQDMQA